MLIRVDLGFHYLVVLVVVVVVLPVIGFVVRRKFRYAAARREEIKRLLVLASEEAARAEQEGTEGYYYTVTPTASASVSNSFPVFNSASVPLDSSPKPQYQCAVCFCPTTTRCAKCKAVRYCSGRCQIVHWRQGHKDECRPYVALNPINVVGGSSYTQRDGKICNFSVDTKDQQTATPVERSADNLHQSDNVVVESLTHRRGTNLKFESTSDSSYNGYSDFSTSTKSSLEESRSDVSQLADATSVHFETVKQEHQTLASPAKKSTSSGKINQNRSDLNDEDSRSGSSSSSCCTDDGSNKSSFSDPSTTSSGFWDGTIPSKKSSIDEIDDIAPNMTDYLPSSRFSLDTTKSDFNIALKNGFIATSIISNGSGPTALGSKKSNDETTSSKKLFNEGLKSTESKISLSGSASHRASAIVGRSKIKDAKAYGGMPSSSPERSNHVFDNSVTSHTSKFMEVDSSLSKVSDARLTSSTSKHASRSTNAVKVDELTENSRSVRNGLRESMLKVTGQLKPSTLTRHGSLVEGSETGHKYSCKGIFSYEMFVKLYNWKIVELQPCGLVNIGNSCYANAVLQCLAYTPPLTAYLLQGLHSKACKKREWCFTCEFEALVQKAKYGNSPLSPIRILSQIENIGRNLGPGRQEDAHEFLRYAIDTWQSVCLKEVGTNAFNSLEEETTLIGLTFGGHLRSQIKCMKCGGKSEQHERMMDLTVEIGGDIGTLEEALNKFTCTEILDGENKYKCSRCKSYEKAKKKLTLLDAPNVLTIALKRFQYGKFGKLNKSIRFPEILDMAPYVSGTSDKSPIYRLYGVVVHLDVMNAAFSGHYVCYVKNAQNRWFKIDDSMVTEVDLQSVLTKGAYLLLYARCSPRAPRSIRSSSIHHHDPRKHKLPSSFMSRPDSTEPWNSCNDHLTKIRHRSLEEESSSSSDNSGIFSESCSCSTESSSHRDWSSIEDHMFDDWEHDRNMNSNSSDSDTSSSSFPSPLGIRERRSMSGKNCRNLGCVSNSNSCRITNFDRLGLRPTNPFESSKSGVSFKRSTIRGRSD